MSQNVTLSAKISAAQSLAALSSRSRVVWMFMSYVDLDMMPRTRCLHKETPEGRTRPRGSTRLGGLPQISLRLTTPS